MGGVPAAFTIAEQIGGGGAVGEDLFNRLKIHRLITTYSHTNIISSVVVYSDNERSRYCRKRTKRTYVLILYFYLSTGRDERLRGDVFRSGPRRTIGRLASARRRSGGVIRTPSLVLFARTSAHKITGARVGRRL